MADPFASFEGRYRTPQGRGGGDPFSTWETNFSVARLNPKGSSRAGGLENLNIKQLGSLGIDPGEMGGDYLKKQVAKTMGFDKFGDSFERMFAKLSDNDRKRLIGAIEKTPRTGLTDILSERATTTPSNWRANVEGNLRELGGQKGGSLMAALMPVQTGLSILDVGKKIPKPIQSFSETYNQNLLGGLGREAVNLGASALPTYLIPGSKEGIQNVKDVFFPEQGARQKSLSPTKRENLDIYGKAGQIAGSGSKALAEMIGTGAMGNAVRAGVRGTGVVKNLLEGGKVAQTAAKAIPFLADSGVTTALQTQGSGGDIKKGVVEGIGYDVGLNVITKGLGKFIKNIKAPDDLAKLVYSQRDIGDVLRVIDNANIPQGTKTQIKDKANDLIQKNKVYAEDFKFDTTSYSKPKKAAYDAFSSSGIKDEQRFDTAVKAYKSIKPGSTDNEATQVVGEIIADINDYTTKSFRQSFKPEAELQTPPTKKGIMATIHNIFNPIKNLDSEGQAIFKKSAGRQYAAQAQASVVRSEIEQLAKKSGIKLDFDLARRIEDGTAIDSEFNRGFRKIADDLRQEAVDSGLDIGYKENYVPHIWKKSADEVHNIAVKFGMRPRAQGERIVPTYEEGIRLGLKPKYKNPADMMADYVRNLQSARSNVALIHDLSKQGLLTDGIPPQGWKSITAAGFPRTANGGMLSAPAQVADVINNIYQSDKNLIEKGLGKTARFNSIWQDIALAGGIPKTPANFFTFSQLMKENALGAGQALTGKPIQGFKTGLNATAAFLRSFSKSATRQFQIDNKGFLKELGEYGAPVRFTEMKPGKWDSLFNDPTFGRFMPAMQLGTAKNVYNQLSKKIPHEEAMQKTADIVKKLYGITDQLSTGRQGAVQDLIGSVAFAPKYRESIVNVLGNTAKAFADPRTWRDSSYSLNRRLGVGIGATLVAYEALNRAITGHSMANNPEGKELSLAIPYGDNKAIYIPFMPSFMTLPRAAVGAAQSLAKGDAKGIGSELGKVLSMPLQVGTQLVTNKDYFGRPIRNDAESALVTGKPEDTPLEASKKSLMYLLGQSSPALVRAAIDKAQGKPLEQVLAQAGELPVRFGDTYKGSNREKTFSKGQVSGDFYDVYNVLESQSRRAEKDINKSIYQGGGQGAKETGEAFNNKVNDKFKSFFDKYGKYLTQEDRDKYQGMIDNIKLDVRQSKKGKLYVNKY